MKQAKPKRPTRAEIEAMEKAAKKKKTMLTAGAVAVALLVIVLTVVLISVYVDNATYYADIEIEGYGTITLQLDRKTAPITVDNFVKLAESGFYDGLSFHRIIDGFMIQGGDPLANGYGGSDEEIFGEFASNGYLKNNISHLRGTVSMARNGQDNNSASSQFFIVHKDSTHLDGDYAAFGWVISGMEIVDKICEDADPVNDNGAILRDEQPVMKKVTIRKEK